MKTNFGGTPQLGGADGAAGTQQLKLNSFQNSGEFRTKEIQSIDLSGDRRGAICPLCKTNNNPKLGAGVGWGRFWTNSATVEPIW